MDNIICTGPVCKNADLCSDFARFIVANKCVENTPRSAESAASPPQSPHPQQHYPVAQSWWTITLIALSWTVFAEVTNALLRTLEISTKTPSTQHLILCGHVRDERRAASGGAAAGTSFPSSPSGSGAADGLMWTPMPSGSMTAVTFAVTWAVTSSSTRQENPSARETTKTKVKQNGGVDSQQYCFEVHCMARR